MKRLLVPTDFSDNALKAALYAAGIARKAKAALCLLHVIEPIDNKVHQPFMLHERYIKETTAMSARYLKEVQNNISVGYPEIKVDAELVSGIVGTSIADFAEKNKFDLIVMGTKGATGMKEIFIGSVTSNLIGLAKIPVLAIPDIYTIKDPNGILFATNHFEESKEKLNLVIELARLFSATIHVSVFVEKNKSDVTGGMDGTRQLDNYVSYLKKAFPEISFRGELLEGKDFGEAVKEYDDKNKLDIISMITYPKGFWKKLFNGSTTRRMTSHSVIPVLAIPAGNSGEETDAKHPF